MTSVRTLVFLVFIVAAILLAGAVLSYPMHLLLSPFFEIPFHKIVHYTTVLTALGLALYYLNSGNRFAPVPGKKQKRGKQWRSLLYGFIAGATILLVIESNLYFLDMRQVDPDLAAGMLPFLKTVLKALLSGLLVGLMEEIIYRGAIFAGVARFTNLASAVVFSSLIYAGVHFIEFPQLAQGAVPGWFTGLDMLSHAFYQFSDPLILDSLLSLSLLGALLCLLRWHSGHLIGCIGLHAGVVTVNKIMSYSTDFHSGSPYEFLVNRYDHLNGYLASLWLIVAMLLYYFFTMKQRPADPD